MTVDLSLSLSYLSQFCKPIGVALIIWLVLRRLRIKSPRLPPGPPPLKVLGIPLTTELPSEQEWVTYTKWAEEYGDLYHIKLLGRDMIVVNSFEAVNDLFEKTSSIYSDRPGFTMLRDIVGFDWHIAFMNYGEEWRLHRKYFHSKFHPVASEDYHPVQLRYTRELLRRLYEEPHNIESHLRHTAGAIIIEIVYGISVKPKNDYFIDIAETAMRGMAEGGNFGTFIVDTIPILKYLPSWIPGTQFLRVGDRCRKATSDMSVIPFQEVKKAMARGEAVASITSSLLEELADTSNVDGRDEEAIRGIGAAAYAAGSDTTVFVLYNFFLAMTCYPEVQRKAQEELDSVIGPHRLPEFGDRGSLPYIELIIKELYRWHPIVPIGVAHAATEEGVYHGFYIPKGAIVVGNAWKILHDEKNYGKDTDKFIPERFLEPGRKDPVISFGFGRRICPGRYMADNSVFIAIASILKVFNITPAKDELGKTIPVKEAFTSGFLSRAEDFQCEVTFRSESSKNLVFYEVPA